MTFAVYVHTATSTRKPNSRDLPARTYRLVERVECANAATAILVAKQSARLILHGKSVRDMGAAEWTGTGEPPHEVITTGTNTLIGVLRERAKYSQP